jgi:hypothetical protein
MCDIEYGGTPTEKFENCRSLSDTAARNDNFADNSVL